MATSMSWAFRATKVTKVYDGKVRANDGISLQVDPGEVYGLLGPNGAGKSTFVKQVIGLLKPTSGQITLGPFDLVEHPMPRGSSVRTCRRHRCRSTPSRCVRPSR